MRDTVNNELATRNDVEVFGVSPDSVERQQKFDDKHGLDHRLLSDPDHEVAEAFGVWGPKKLYGKTYDGITRSAFLIDEEGRIEGAWYKVKPADTPTRLLEALNV